MKHTKRIFCTLLAAVLLLSMGLTGCSLPKLTIGGTPDVAGTIGGREVSTGEYLAYLYNTFYEMYYSQGLYYYEYYGVDPWSQPYTYGEGDSAQKVNLSEYITLQTQATMVRQDALQALMKEYGISWIEKEEADMDKELAELEKDVYLSLGFSNENFIKSYKNLYLNERSLFLGLYGKDGPRAVSEEDQRAYFEKNYLSYKIISIPLTGTDKKELDEAGKKKITDQLNGYLAQYNKDKNFEAVVDAYNKANAGKDQKVEPSKDEDNRIDVDAEATDMDTQLEKAIRSVPVGTAKVVTYKDGGTTPTAALILRLDINKPEKLFTDSYEDILTALKYEEFDKEVTAKADKITAVFDAAVTKKCKPENFLPTA